MVNPISAAPLKLHRGGGRIFPEIYQEQTGERDRGRFFNSVQARTWPLWYKRENPSDRLPNRLFRLFWSGPPRGTLVLLLFLTVSSLLGACPCGISLMTDHRPLSRKSNELCSGLELVEVKRCLFLWPLVAGWS
ncbi:hypothetical protein CDAR_261791 [Caerostris darwini]|uniref:Uncharacterized protein n=1 Tax=Caerostris darwini TaxID=1538125 RepID=A0AAV4V1N8_9ARAC|nr:hypothetical protein CDAR_261791 [Caerostris darwini]